MIVGIGVDMCSVARVRKAVANAHFIERVFSPEEIEYANSQGDPARHYASAYAAKEALAKASGFGMFGMGINSSWVERTESGPVVRCDEELLDKLKKRGARKILLSLTHEGDFALAFLVLES